MYRGDQGELSREGLGRHGHPEGSGLVVLEHPLDARLERDTRAVDRADLDDLTEPEVLVHHELIEAKPFVMPRSLRPLG